MLIGWVLFVSSKQIERNRRIQEEVSSLENEAAKIRRENETLSEKIQYFSSDTFREQEAKSKLGLKKTDETMVIIKTRPGFVTEAGDTEKTEGTQTGQTEPMPNYKKLWRIFF